MLPWDHVPGHITDDAQTHGATTRTDIISISSEDHAYVDIVSDRETSDFTPSTAQSSQQLEDTNDNTSVRSRATTTSPAEDNDDTPKRSASTEPTDQPDMKRIRVSTPSDGDSNGAGVAETDQPSSQHLQQLEQILADENTTSSATITSLAENVDATPKRPASTQPTDQPDLKRFKASTPSDGNGDDEGFDETESLSIQHAKQLETTPVGGITTPKATTSPHQPEHTPIDSSTPLKAKTPPPTKNTDAIPKRSASVPPAGQPDPKRAKIFIPADENICGGGFMSIRHAHILAKRRALAQSADQPALKSFAVLIPTDGNGGRGGFERIYSPLVLKVGLFLRASTKVPGEISSGPEQVGNGGVGDKGKDETGKDKTDKDRVDKDKVDKNNVDKDKAGKGKVDDDSDELEIISETPVKPISDWKDPDAARFTSAKKSKSKQPEQLGTPDTEASPSARKSAAKASNARGKSISQAVNLEEEEDEEEEDEEEDESESEHEYPQVSMKKIIQADKNISKACRQCKIDANKLWKGKYDAMVSRLNSEHKAAIRALKAEGAAALKNVKATADKEKKAAKAKADKAVANVKDTLGETLDAREAKLGGEIKTLKKNLATEKEKVVDLKSKLENAEELRKRIEKDSAETVKKCDNDRKANNAELRERWKQLKRESQAEIDQHKPELAKTVKDNQRIIKDLTQKFLAKEKELERSEEDLISARKQRGVDKYNHKQTLKELAKAKASDEQRVDQIMQYERHNKAIQERAASDVARVEEALATSQTNLQQQSIRVVEKQRNNYNLQDALRRKVDLADARKREIEVLKRQLQAARAELEVAMGIEDMDVVEVVRAEVVKGEGVK
jgi:hypothetical protein